MAILTEAMVPPEFDRRSADRIGDLVLSLELLDPETSLPILTVWRWTEVGPGAYDFTSLMPAAGTTFACANAGFMTFVPYTAFGNSTYADGTFAEASIDLSALLALIQPSSSFQTVFFDSRLGSEIASALRDFIEPIPTQITTDVGPARSSGVTRIVGQPGSALEVVPGVRQGPQVCRSQGQGLCATPGVRHPPRHHAL